MKLTEVNIVKKEDVFQEIGEQFTRLNKENRNFWNHTIIRDAELPDVVIVCGYKEKTIPNFLNLLSWSVFIPISTADMSDKISRIYKNTMFLQKKHGKEFLNLLSEKYNDDRSEVTEIMDCMLSYVNEHRPEIDLTEHELNYIEVSEYDKFVERWGGWAKKQAKQNNETDGK